MRYFSLDDFILRPRITGAAFESFRVKRGQVVPFTFQFVSGGAGVDLSDSGLAGTLLFKEKGKFDAQTAIVSADMQKSGTGINTVYFFAPDFSGPDLDSLLNVNSIDKDDLPGIALAGEIQIDNSDASPYAPAGPIKTINLFEVIVENDIVRGGETANSYPATGKVIDLKDVTAIIGGASGDLTFLDSIPAANYPDGTKFDVIVTVNGTRSWSRWEKGSGSTPSNVATGYVLCLDGTQLVRVAGY